MKKIFFVLATFTFSTVMHALGQVGVYCHDGFLNDQRCGLYLEIKDGKYRLDLYYELSMDLSTGTTLSIGKCCDDGKNMVLTDELFGYIMVFERIDSRILLMRKGFMTMRDTSFEYLREPTSAPFVYSSDTRDFIRDPYRVKQENCKAKRERKVGFQAGDYSLGNEKNYLLKIEDNGRFTYFYHGVQISKGKWKRCGNLLALIDDGLNKPFFAIIKEKGIVSSYLPGAFIDSVWESN